MVAAQKEEQEAQAEPISHSSQEEEKEEKLLH